MKLFKHKLATLVLIALSIFAAQLGSAMTAFAADPPSDLIISISSLSHDRFYSYSVCNNGPTSVIAFTVDEVFTGFTPDQFLLSPFEGISTGTVNSSNGNWTGTLPGDGSCIAILISGEVTNSTVSYTATIAGSTLGDSTANDEVGAGTTSDNSVSSNYFPIVSDSDLELTTRLTTSNITSGTNITYALTIASIGNADYEAQIGNPGDLPKVYFLMPDGATFTSVTDSNTGDRLDVTGCTPQGDISGFGPQMAQYSGIVIECQFDIDNVDLRLPTGESYEFELNLQATSSFVSGTTEAIGVIVGGDSDTLYFLIAQAQGGDFFNLPINNIILLTFDGTPLIPTFTPCTGQGSVVTSNSACFRISFNKPINEPDFTGDDLLLSGGNVSSFTQLGPNLWEVKVSGMTSGTTLKVEIIPNRLKDYYSAVENGVQVLGINTVRYESGTLPETGKHVDWITPMILMSAGFALLKSSKFYSIRLTQSKCQS